MAAFPVSPPAPLLVSDCLAVLCVLYTILGHSLTYFRGNDNIPVFAKEAMLQRIVAPQTGSAAVRQLMATGGRLPPHAPPDPLSLTWKMTFNTYSRMPSATGAGANDAELQGDAGTISGFPFHMDLPANGPITMIATLLHPATLQLVHKDHQEAVEHAEGSGGHADHDGRISSVLMEPGSLLVLSNESRWDWRHRVLPTKPVLPKQQLGSSPDGSGDIARMSIVFGCSL